MQRPASWLAVGCVVLVIPACTTTEIQKVELKTFTTAMSQNLKVVDTKIDNLNLPGKLAQDRRQRLAAAGGFYELGSDCVVKPSALLTEAENLSAPYFDERCTKTPLDARADRLALGVSTDLDHAIAAQRTSADLSEYVEALSELISTDQPAQVASKLAASLAALNKLAESAAGLSGKKIDKNITKTVQTGSTLAETLAREGLEAMRYRAASAIVHDADDAVYEACLQLALWLAKDEDENMKADLDALKDAEEAATLTAITQFAENRSDQAALDSALLEFDRRYDAVSARDRKAQWRVFISAAQAHRALRDAFDRPADIETAAVAHARLDTLARQTIAFVKAAENL